MQEINNNGSDKAITGVKEQPDEFFGMKILFDKPVGLYPVKLDKRSRSNTIKTTGRNNGYN